MEFVSKVKNRLTGAYDNTKNTAQKTWSRIATGSPMLIDTGKGHISRFTQMNRTLIGRK